MNINYLQIINYALDGKITYYPIINVIAAAVSQSVRAIASHAEGWVFDFQLRHI